ncbi:MAG: YcxB family protein [Clostridium sp.]|nr:YcxB family protein [Clostridium sp.]
MEELEKKYSYTYRNTAPELWQLSMYYTYGSMVGLCNIIFTAASFAMVVSRWHEATGFMKFLIAFGCCLFTIIQPSLVYVKAKRQAAAVTEDTHISFDEGGLHVKVGEERWDAGWDAVKRISKKPTMIILFSDSNHGFVLTNRILGEDRESFYQFALSGMNRLRA